MIGSRDAMAEDIRQYFSDMVVYKDLKKSNFFSSIGLPSFMRDWLLRKFEDESGNFDQATIDNFVKRFIPRSEDWNSVKSRIITDNEIVKILAKISINIDVKTGEVSFNLPDYGLTNRETIIDSNTWDACKDSLVKGNETWGLLELAYRPASEIPKVPGKIRLVSFQSFCPYQTDLSYYKDVSSFFRISDWIDVLLGAIDYNSKGYESEEAKLTMLTRLLPFVEKRLNLIELAPKGTGKSYLYGRVSRFGWLSNGGTMSRAKMFYDISRHTEGLISGHDFITLDEVQTISFSDVPEMRAILKGYLESGVFTVGNYEGKADAGVILCGNVSKEAMDLKGYANMMEELPEVFHESALIERFHGIIKGWDIPRMNDDMKVSGWALNSEYFCSIMHDLRNDLTYRAIIDDLILVPVGADTRDTEAVKRISTAYLKLLFPWVKDSSDIDPRIFKRYCLDRAVEMRHMIRVQLSWLDSEYRGKDVPDFGVKGL